MRSLIPLRLKTLRSSAYALLCRTALLVAVAAALIPALTASAQEPAVTGPGSAHKDRPAKAPQTPPAAQPAAQTTQQAAPAVPDAPPAPAWPVNRQAQPARVVWDSHGLKIDASNSSLDQILHEISVDTGVKIEGFSKDQRIFGTYGPGPAREVLSRLLDGSEYNVLMVGGAGNAPPSRIVLSTTGPAGPPPPPGMQNNNQPEDEDVEAEEPPQQEQPPPPLQLPREPPPPTPIRNPFGDTPRVPMPVGGGQPPMFGQPTNPQPMPPDQNSPPQQ